MNDPNRKPHKYDEYFQEFERKGGRVTQATKPVGRPNMNTENIPFDKWDWEKEDADFYKSYMRLPDSKDPVSFQQVKWNRYHQSTPRGAAHMKDFRPRTMLRVMRWEVLAFTTSVMLGIFWLPGYFKNKMHEGMTPNQNVQYNPVTMREPQVQRMDVNTLKNNYDQQMANAIRPHQAYQNMSYNGGAQQQPQQQDLPYQQSHTPYNQQQYQNYHPSQGQPAYPGQLSPYEQQQDEIQRRQFAMEVERLQLQSQMKNQQMEEAQKYGGLGGTHGYLK